MPRKINFSVVSATSEENKYKATELNHHGPTVKGWQSAKKCNYPQEIVLKLRNHCLLHKMQILAHQFLIPSRIELYCVDNPDLKEEEIRNVPWQYLGYVTLSNNETTNFKSRELKSANVPQTRANFVKLKLSNNYENINNVDNQVSIIAINVLGDMIEFKSKEDSSEPDSIFNDREYFSPYEDLAFEMYVDVEVANLIKTMDLKKISAVTNERFEYARKLKEAMEVLRVSGEKLAKYELEKRHAIELEDYEKARHKKDQIDEFRSSAYQQVRLDQLLEQDGICQKNDNCDEQPEGRVSSSPNNHSSASPLQRSRQPSPKWGSPVTGSPTSRGFRRRNKSAGSISRTTYEMYEEKPVPALKHSHTNEFLRECQLEENKSTRLSEREKKQASLPIVVFGHELVEKIYSKHYSDKEEGLNRLRDELISYDRTRTHTPNKIARAAVFLLHRTLRDKVFSVYSLTNEIIRLFFAQFVPSRVASAEVARSVDKLLPELLTKSGDQSARIHHMAVHTILTMADSKNVRDLNIIPVNLSRAVSSSTHPRLALSRAEMVEQLIINHGISTEKQSGLTCRILSEFGASGLHHPAEAVRKVSERILILVYRVNPRLVRKQLPPDDNITRRNLLYRHLFHEFDKIDSQRKTDLSRTNNSALTPCFSPEVQKDLIKFPSASNIQNIFRYDGYALSKSLSGGNITQANGTKKNSSGSASGVSSPSNDSLKEEKRCIFCNQTEKSILSISNSMNSHYWRSCPMLFRCRECNQVVEVSLLTEHLICECEKREMYTQCPQCTEAVRVTERQNHRAMCKELKEGCNRCPLCHYDLQFEEQCWTKHLMGENSCPNNNKTPKGQISKHVKIKT